MRIAWMCMLIMDPLFALACSFGWLVLQRRVARDGGGGGEGEKIMTDS